ncbi:MAG: ATP-binding protein [Acidobacteria bacterium]|nr:ATP-binding protein [Acidobacteriota bacterium]
MKIKSINIKNHPPIQCFQVDNLTHRVVIAGQNGVGKTRIIRAIIELISTSRENETTQLIIEATTDLEKGRWKKSTLDTNVHQDKRLLFSTVSKQQQKTNWQSSFILIESRRFIDRISNCSLPPSNHDPSQDKINWNTPISPLKDRFENTVHSLLQMLNAQNNKIAEQAKELRKSGHSEMKLDFPDILMPYKLAFSQLLTSKVLLDPDLRNQKLNFSENGQIIPIENLSSGEREVVNIVFDFLFRSPSDCIVLFDEPELHLHPELAKRLLQALQDVSPRNQFIYCTHSSHIITSSLPYSVVFIKPPGTNGENQALPVKADDEIVEALQLLGHSLGVLSLGKKIVLIEGKTNSLDVLVYKSIVEKQFSDFVLLPSEGKHVIQSFDLLNTKVLQKTLWGVEFFMLRDRDAIPLSDPKESVENTVNSRIRYLSRYHLENYFLDEQVWAKAFEKLFIEEKSDLRSPDQIRKKILDLAKENIPYAVALYVSAEMRKNIGNVDLMPRDCHSKPLGELLQLIAERAVAESNRVKHKLDQSQVETTTRTIALKLEESLKNADEWKTLIPGKNILNRFLKDVKQPIDQAKRAYIQVALESGSEVFKDIQEIFADFSAFGKHQ